MPFSLCRIPAWTLKDPGLTSKVPTLESESAFVLRKLSNMELINSIIQRITLKDSQLLSMLIEDVICNLGFLELSPLPTVMDCVVSGTEENDM